MTRAQAVGVVLIALGLIYALLYAAWLRKRRRHTSAAVAVAGDGGGERAAEAPGAVVTAEGTYVSTTTAASRHERVAVESETSSPLDSCAHLPRFSECLPGAKDAREAIPLGQRIRNGLEGLSFEEPARGLLLHL